MGAGVVGLTALLDIRIRVGGEVVHAELVRQNLKTVWVRLADGHIVKRRKRDLL